MAYSVREIFYTLQGEGAQAGRPAVFCRFTGCNLWTGRENDRAHAVCRFCDTDFAGTDGVLGGVYENSEELAITINQLWPKEQSHKYVVFTGGEPLLQLDKSLVDTMHQYHFEVAVETNGTLPVPSGVDWICVSPKTGTKLAVTAGNELKLVVPQEGQSLSDYEDMAFVHFYLQPLDNHDKEKNTQFAIEMCRQYPKWKLSLQIHKYLNIP